MYINSLEEVHHISKQVRVKGFAVLERDNNTRNPVLPPPLLDMTKIVI
jgi:hypothetical protein